MGQFLPCFKAYDVRGIVPTELNPDIAEAIGRAYADETGANTVCIGRDIRLSGPELAAALARGLNAAGVDVIDLGLVGTEMVYFATATYGYDGGIMITASHNPPEYNGMKMVRSESRPISGDTGLYDIERRAHERRWERSGQGTIREQNVYEDFVRHLLTFADPQEMKPLRILANPGNGAAGVAMEALMPHLPLVIDPMHFEPDGHFPNGVPNPILPEARADMEARMRAAETAGTPYDFGVAWDGDYDRCFFLDEHGQFIEGYYIVGLLAQALLTVNPDHTIIYDPRLTWNTLDIDLEHARHRGPPRWPSRDLQERTRVHQREDAGRERDLRRRDERPSLLQRALVLRQRDDPVHADRPSRVRLGQDAWRACRSDDRGLSV